MTKTSITILFFISVYRINLLPRCRVYFSSNDFIDFLISLSITVLTGLLNKSFATAI